MEENDSVDKILSYTLQEEDLQKTAGGLVNLVLKECVRVTGHEISAAKFIEDGITCEGEKIRVNERMSAGQTLRIVLPEERDGQKLIPVEGPVRILYEDEDLIAVDKAAGEVVHPCPGHYQDTVANYLTWYLHKEQENREKEDCEKNSVDGNSTDGDRTRGWIQSKTPGEVRDQSGLRIIGRLDKETSGVLIFARNRAAAARLQRQRQEGQFVRTYVAVCEGTFRQESMTGIIDQDMEKIPGVLMKMHTCENGTGLHAVTHYEVLEQDSDSNTSVVRCRIETGRTHQIRVHMASIGHPLVGDTLYGSEASDTLDHVKSMAEGSAHALLTAVSVDCLQPFTGEKLHIASRTY